MKDFNMWKLINGGWPGPWVINELQIKEFIVKYKLKPISHESLPTRALEHEAKASPEAKLQVNPIYIIDPRGGMRNPHLHYRGQIYLLDSELWNKFSGQIVREFSEKLAKTNSVSYNQLVELSDTMNAIV